MIEWLLGGSTAVGVAGVVVLAIYIARQAGRNRSDLLEQVSLVKQLAAAGAALDAHVHAIEDLNHALTEKSDELARERAGSASLRDSLNAAFEEMAKSGTASGAVLALRGALDRLSKMSSVPGTAAPEDDHGAGGVHGAPAADDRGDGLKDRDPGP